MRRITVSLALAVVAALGVAPAATARSTDDVVATVATGCTKTAYTLESHETSGAHLYEFRHDGEVIRHGAIWPGQTIATLLNDSAGQHSSRILVDGVVVASDGSGPCKIIGFEWTPRR